MACAVDRRLALALLRRLSGFRGYPTNESGETRFVEVLQESCISVEHMRLVIDAFEEFFPTIKEIRDTAYSIRQANFPNAPSIEQWKAEGATHDPAFAKRLSKELMTSMSDRLEDRIIADIRRTFGIVSFFNLTQPQIKSMKRACGYELNSYERQIADQWDENHGRPVPVAREEEPQQPDLKRIAGGDAA